MDSWREKMNDILKILEEHKDIKDIKDLIDEIKELRKLYSTQEFEKMMKHINKLTQKYLFETFTWNSINKIMPQTFEQQYINAENFLSAQATRILADKGIKIIQQS